MKPWVRRAVAFAVTFLAYMSVHIVRKPSSVLKSVLHPQDSYDPEAKPGWAPFNQDLVPERVAKSGFRVQGARDEQHNGHYVCSARVPEGSGACGVFQEKQHGEFSVARVKGSVCQRHVDQAYAGEFCWVLHSTAALNAWPIFMPAPIYAQLSSGELPQPLRTGDVNLDDKAWKSLEDGYQPYSKLRVKPDIQDGKVLLGLMDTVFLLAYTVGLFVSGWLADRLDVRRFLGVGMINAGFSSIFLGLGHRFKVHSMTYFLVVSAWGGLAQSAGWPCCVSVLGKWFPRTYRRRGLVMGAWSANLSIGNILGSVITTACVGWGMHGGNWPLGFEVPGWIVILFGFVVLQFLEAEPTGIEQDNDYDQVSSSLLQDIEEEDIDNDDDLRPQPTFTRALMIPGVIPFSLCLCFAKMGQYALLFWGPYYLQVVGFSSERAGYLCSFFDVGGLLGGIAAGWLSDRLKGKRGLTAGIFLVLAALALLVYYHVTSRSGTKIGVNIWMMILVGFWVNGPVSLITTAVSADLGSHPSLKGDERMLASVAGIIDGAGSFGAAMQGILIGVISTSSWEKVFQFLVTCCLLAGSLLIGVIRREFRTS